MRKITFKGTESEHSLYCPPGTAPSVKRALEARGYGVQVGSEVNPWREIPQPEQMIAATGRLTKTEAESLLFLAASEGAMDAAWEAIRLYFPEAQSNPMEKLDRPA